MRKIYLFIVLLLILFMLLCIGNKSYAKDLDEIVNYEVTVDPRMNDGSLDIIYEISWKVLDSDTEGPLEWVSIGTPNSNFDTPTALTKNIKNISKYKGSYVKITFDKKYYAGETVTFKYSIHQSYMYKISGSNCNYNFTPAWFTDSKVDNLVVRWNSDKVEKSNSEGKEGNYLVWRKTNMAKGSKLNTSIQYKKTAFTALNENKQKSSNDMDIGFIIALVIFVLIIAFIAGCFGGGGYYGHRGFYGGRHYGGFYSSCVHSSCACACAHSCACACAGSGRAGCSKKDFYGTNLNTEKLKKAIAKQEELKINGK